MKRQHLIVIMLFAMLLTMAIPLTNAATATLAAPTVTLPNSNWKLTDSVTYPDSTSEHDPAGAGMLEYTDQTNYDVINIYYEKAQVSTYSATQLKTQAEGIFDTYDTSGTRSLDSSGTKDYAGVSAGFAMGTDVTDITAKMELVLIKGEYFINVHAYYDDTTASKNNVDSIINSMGVAGSAGTGGAFFGSTMFFAIIGVVVAVIVIVVVVVLVRRKKPVQPQQQAQYGYPPPPPPTAT